MRKPAGHNSGGLPWRVGYAAPTSACQVLAPDILRVGNSLPVAGMSLVRLIACMERSATAGSRVGQCRLIAASHASVFGK